VSWSGKTVGKNGAFALRADRLAPLPYTPWALLGSELLGGSGKLAFLRVLSSLGERKAEALRGQSVQDWLAAAAHDPGAHALLSMLVRLTCYAHAPELLGADAAVRQLARLARHGVDYLDGGWQSLLDALLAQLRESGVALELGVGVREIERQAGRVSALITRDGRRLPAGHVVAAVDPQTLAALLPDDALAARWAQTAVPLRAACLDLGVRGPLPHPERLNVQSLDAPLYFANHSAYARLAPEGAHVLSLVRYLGPGEDGRASRSSGV
jgi:phytoene dehydrogenase-like protein